MAPKVFGVIDSIRRRCVQRHLVHFGLYFSCKEVAIIQLCLVQVGSIQYDGAIVALHEIKIVSDCPTAGPQSWHGVANDYIADPDGRVLWKV